MSRHAIIQLCTEFFPTLIFFVAGQTHSFITATWLLCISTALSLLISLWQLGRVPFLPLVSSAFVVVSGAITIHFHNPQALILADSLYFLLIAFVIVSGLASGKYFIKWLFEATFAIHDEGWKILSYRWLKLLLAAGIANEIVRHTAPPEVWVDYRFIKILLIMSFALYQFRVARRFRITDESNSWGIRTVTQSEVTEHQTKHIDFSQT